MWSATGVLCVDKVKWSQRPQATDMAPRLRMEVGGESGRRKWGGQSGRSGRMPPLRRPFAATLRTQVQN